MRRLRALFLGPECIFCYYCVVFLARFSDGRPSCQFDMQGGPEERHGELTIAMQLRDQMLLHCAEFILIGSLFTVHPVQTKYTMVDGLLNRRSRFVARNKAPCTSPRSGFGIARLADGPGQPALSRGLNGMARPSKDSNFVGSRVP